MLKLNLTIIHGDSKTWVLNFTKDGAPINVTGWTVFFTVKSEYIDDDAHAKITKTIVAAGTDAMNGKVGLALTSQDTDIDIGNYVYDIKLQTDTSDRETMTEGTFRVNPTVTIRTS